MSLREIAVKKFHTSRIPVQCGWMETYVASSTYIMALTLTPIHHL